MPYEIRSMSYANRAKGKDNVVRRIFADIDADIYLMKETQPLRLFGAFAALFMSGGVIRMAGTGLILDSDSRGRAEQKRIFCLGLPLRSEQGISPRQFAALPSSARRAV